MADSPNLGYYGSGQGSLTGFDAANIPIDNPNISVTGWSVEQLRAFLSNQSDINFPSNEWILRVENLIREHEADFNNPHRTTLDQIVGDFVIQVLGNITPGTIPDVIPFFSFDALMELPIGTIFPATYTSSNLYRQTSGGWLADPSTESDIIGTDYITNRPGIPLFSGLTNVTPINWASAAGVLHSTVLVPLADASINYPFTFQQVQETPVVAQFAFDLLMTEDIQTNYTSTFFIYPSDALGSLRIFQPSDPASYVEVSLTDGSFAVFSTTVAAACVRYVNGVIRVSVNFTALTPTPDNRLRIVHLNNAQEGDGTRQGSLGRTMFSIAQPQTTKAALNQPVMKDLSATASTSKFTLDLARLNTPATINNVIITMSLNLYPTPLLVSVVDPTIMTFGSLVITRDQSVIRVSVDGNPVFTSDILEGLNTITLSYSPTKLIFKDLAADRQELVGTFAALPTTNVTMGPMGGYLHYLAFYAQSDTNQVVEYLNNG